MESFKYNNRVYVKVKNIEEKSEQDFQSFTAMLHLR